MSSKPALGFIGSGNTAWNLAPAFAKAGYTVAGIASRNEKTGKQLARKLKTAFQTKEELTASADVCFICVQDRYIEEIASGVTSKTILIHCSGSAPLSALGQNRKTGVFYPVISMKTGFEINFEKIPVCIESDDKKVFSILAALGKSIGAQTSRIDSDKRRSLHLAAVFVNNFSNALYIAAKDVLTEAGVDFKLLNPLLMETALSAINSDPLKNQTGPARRDDKVILKKHLEMLKSFPEEAKVYRTISNYIRQRFS